MRRTSVTLAAQRLAGRCQPLFAITDRAELEQTPLPARQQVLPEPAAGQVFPVEILRPAVRIPDPEAPALRNDLVAADVHGDHSPPSRKSVLRSCRNELCAILPLLAGETIVHCLYAGDVILNPLKERETWTIST